MVPSNLCSKIHSTCVRVFEKLQLYIRFCSALAFLSRKSRLPLIYSKHPELVLGPLEKVSIPLIYVKIP